MALTWPLVKDGSTGENVRSVQYLVTAHGHPTGVDGIFGPLTKAAVEAFQTSQGLGVDGAVGNQTWPKLIIQVASGSHGDAVKAVQDHIHNRGDGHVLAVDGSFGPDTDSAVRSFQSLLGLAVDGIVGPVTWNHLANEYLNAPSPQAAATRTFDAWKAHNEASAGKNATPGAVAQLFNQTWSASAGWAFENCQGAAGHTFCSWRRNNGKELRLGVQNAVSGPFYVVESATFT